MDSTYITPTYETGVTSSSAATDAAVMGVIAVFYGVMLVVGIICVVSMWKAFTKAGKPGWAAIVPIYNNIVQLEIAGRPAWWVLLTMFVPFFGTWVGIVAMIDFVRSYQRSGLWVLGMVLVPFVAFPLFAFSNKTQYSGPIAAGRTDFMPAPVPTAQPAYAAPVAAHTPVAQDAPTQPTPPKA